MPAHDTPSIGRRLGRSGHDRRAGRGRCSPPPGLPCSLAKARTRKALPRPPTRRCTTRSDRAAVITWRACPRRRKNAHVGPLPLAAASPRLLANNPRSGGHTRPTRANAPRSIMVATWRPRSVQVARKFGPKTARLGPGQCDESKHGNDGPSDRGLPRLVSRRCPEYPVHPLGTDQLTSGSAAVARLMRFVGLQSPPQRARPLAAMGRRSPHTLDRNCQPIRSWPRWHAIFDDAARAGCDVAGVLK